MAIKKIMSITVQTIGNLIEAVVLTVICLIRVIM